MLAYRRGMPRFYADNYAENLQLLSRVEKVAKAENMTLAQLALSWLLGRDDNIVPIPGTTRLDHLAENFSAVDLQLSSEAFEQLDQIMNQKTVSGTRYNPATQTEIDTEEFM